jgi:NAD(P)-dependent dehydrogenase (short-subunit alcohol dehydrogenase family)
MNQQNLKVVMVTGASSGIGAAICERFAEKPYQFVLVGRNEESLNEIKSRLEDLGSNVTIVVCDLSSKQQIEDLAQEFEKSFSRLDILINCAGETTWKPINEVSFEEFQKELTVNLTAPFYLTKLVSHLISEEGSVINIASVAGRRGGTQFSSIGYAASKAGLINMTKTLAVQFSARKIRVNCVAPGTIYPTGMTKGLSEEKLKAVLTTIPLGRLGKPEEIADVVAFLCSSKAAFITGQTIDVNGGSWMN